MANLSPGQFGPLYHGTRGTFDTVLPPKVTGAELGPGTPQDGPEAASGKYAYAITTHPTSRFPDPDMAENYAWKMAERTLGEGRPRVYEVAPADDMQPGPFNHGRVGALPEMVSEKGFKVRNQIDIQPGRQGTFPQVNWNEYKTEGRDANHPHDEVSSRHPVDFRQLKDAEQHVAEHNDAQRRADGLFPVTPDLLRRWR